MDISDRMQCPPDFPAAAAIVAMGSVLGRQIGIRPKCLDNWTEVANLWGLIVGRPGTMKSPAMNEALGPLRRLEAKARDEHLEALTSYEREANIHKLRKNAAEEYAKKKFKISPNATLDVEIPAEPDTPKAKRFIVSDATYEALGAILVNNPNGILAFRDELVALLKTLDKEEYAAARGFFLSAWDGKQGYTFDRIGRGHQHIESVCVSMLGSTQPGKLATYIGRALKGGDGDDGMIQRFGVLTWPDQGQEWRNVDRLPDSSAKELVHKVFDWLSRPNWAHVQPSINPDDNSRYLSFDPQASELFIAWLGDLESELRSGILHVSLESHFAKYRKLVPALALINHMADGQSGFITTASLERAIGYATYLKTHAKRAYSAGLRSEATAAAAILSRIRKGELADGFTLREIHQRDWSNLTDRDQIKSGLDMLLDYEWLRYTEISTGGRPKGIYSINPTGLR
ncbi:YfjI family protein [Methylobacterium goesingense]|uniref:DNA primase/helicase n=1 Tax=Methylobacterium goesingense TaxID=243690 RepID=A0ABV2L9P1_9HYPH|nr:YfjI family protein [Methylobacterium goesingense]